MINLRKLSLAMLTIFSVLLLYGFSGSTFAAAGDSCELKKSGPLGMPTWYKYLQGQAVEARKGDQTILVCSVKLYGDSIKVEYDSDGKVKQDDLADKPAESANTLSKNISAIGLAIVEILMRILIYASIVWAIWGGYEMIISGGNSQNFKNGVNRIKNALVGLGIGVLSTAIISFVATKLTS